MAQRRIATKAEKEIIDRVVHALVFEDIAKKVMDVNFPEYGVKFRAHMKKECPQYYRLLDELQKAMPRVHKQMSEQIDKEGWESVTPKDLI